MKSTQSCAGYNSIAKGGVRGKEGTCLAKGACMVKGGVHGERGGMRGKGVACVAKGQRVWQKGVCALYAHTPALLQR